MMAKLSCLIENVSHPLNGSVTALDSSFSDSLLHPPCQTEACFMFDAAVRSARLAVDE